MFLWYLYIYTHHYYYVYNWHSPSHREVCYEIENVDARKIAHYLFFGKNFFSSFHTIKIEAHMRLKVKYLDSVWKLKLVRLLITLAQENLSHMKLLVTHPLINIKTLSLKFISLISKYFLCFSIFPSEYVTQLNFSFSERSINTVQKIFFWDVREMK